MILASGIFSESMGLDVTVIGGMLTGFATIIGLLVQLKKNRSSEIKSAVMEVINASPEKIVVNPQPLMIAMQERYVSRDDLALELLDIRRRISSLELSRDHDRKDLLEKIDAVPAKIIAILKDTKGLL
jgi:hypothetical protein